MDTMPGDREACAAISYLHEQTVTPSGWPFRIGQTVRCPRGLGGGWQTGTIVARETDRYLGTVYQVDTPDGRLMLQPEFLEPAR